MKGIYSSRAQQENTKHRTFHQWKRLIARLLKSWIPHDSEIFTFNICSRRSVNIDPDFTVHFVLKAGILKCTFSQKQHRRAKSAEWFWEKDASSQEESRYLRGMLSRWNGTPCKITIYSSPLCRDEQLASPGRVEWAAVSAGAGVASVNARRRKWLHFRWPANRG